MIEPAGLPGQYALTGGLIFDGERLLSGQALCIGQEKIQALVPEGGLPKDIATVDAGGMLVTPGFVDLQINGCGGVLFNDAISADTLGRMHACNLGSGCTSFLPTLITSGEESMRAAMRLVAEYRSGSGPANILGLHLEGPYINRERKGIHNEAFIQPLSRNMRRELCAFAGHTPLMLTLAPECVDAEDIHALSTAGVVVSLGHSAATYEETRRGMAAGASAATHLFNAMSPWQSREPGMVGAILEAADLPCGMIVDGLHSHFASIGLAKRLKGERCFLVTDATPPVGAGDMAEFDFCGQTVQVRDGRCLNADGTLGGSLLTMIRAVENCVRRVGIPLEESLRMASLYPARLMGQDKVVGSVRPGCYANLALFSPDTFAMWATVDRGRLHRWQA